MIRYAGPQPDDPRPVGGGSFNRANIGHEVYNFRVLSGGRLEGYVEAGGMSLDRIDPQAHRDAQSLPGVLVIFFAADKQEGRQVVVGWYRDATVHSAPIRRGARQRDGFAFNLAARSANAVLLPPEDRDLIVPKGRGGTGQSNIYYALDTNGQPRKLAWIRRIVEAVKRGAARNALEGAASTIEHAAEVEVENAAVASHGQGRLVNAAARRAIEQRAMKVARAYFSRAAKVTDVSKSQPYDLLCESKRNGKLRVEVKGTQGNGDVIMLTRREVRSARAPGVRALAVVVGIQLKQLPGRKWQATGGRLRVCMP